MAIQSLCNRNLEKDFLKKISLKKINLEKEIF